MPPKVKPKSEGKNGDIDENSHELMGFQSQSDLGCCPVSGEQVRINCSFSSYLSPLLGDGNRHSTPRPHKQP